MAEGNMHSVGGDDRIMSLDVFRGITLFLLIAEVTGIYGLLVNPQIPGPIIPAIALQFQHHPWEGIRLWDLGQPFFMFISGVALCFSFCTRWENGESWRTSFVHALYRSFLLIFFGWALYRITPVVSNPHWTFLYDVLPQLAFGNLVAFLIMRRRIATQLLVAFGLLFFTEIAYRLWPIQGFNQPFTPGHNFGAYIDFMIFGELSGGHWVVFNMVPAAAYTIWGVLAGHVLRSRRLPSKKMQLLLFAGIGGAGAGLALSFITPIIRRINTSSFVILSGGLGLIMFALSYWIVDLLRMRKPLFFFSVVGMNPLFIYLFTQSGGGEWIRRITEPFSMGLFGWRGEWSAHFFADLVILGLFWSLCYWLYKRRIFFRI